MIQVISILEKFYYSSVCFPFAPPRKHLGKNTQVRGHTSIAIRVAGKKNRKKCGLLPNPWTHPRQEGSINQYVHDSDRI